MDRSYVHFLGESVGRPRNPVDFRIILCVYFLVVFSGIVWSIYRLNKHAPLQEQVVALKEGETFVGVIERRRGQYVFIGDNVGRYEESLTPEEIRLLRQDFDKNYE